MRKFLGLIFILLGVGFILEKFNLIPSFGSLIGTWWPLIIVLIGINELSDNKQGEVGPYLIILLGILLQLNELSILRVSAWDLFWPIVLILIGYKLLIKPERRAIFASDSHNDFFVAFGEINKKIKEKPFEGASFTVLFGAATLDLRDAEIKEGAMIKVFTAFGGGEILVPDNCQVVLHPTPIFGGWDDKSHNNQGPKLIIDGVSLFGGLDIK